MKASSLLLLAAFIVPAAAAEAPGVSEEALRDYKAMHKMTEFPHPIDVQFALLCSPPPQGLVEAEKKRTGPHFEHYVNVYMNDAAQDHFTSKVRAAYPTGSIVVKEKLQHTFDSRAPMKTTAVAGLIKHPPGYNSETGDWEFFFTDASGKMERSQTKLVSCAECHRNSATDYVFGDFAKPLPSSRPSPKL